MTSEQGPTEGARREATQLAEEASNLAAFVSAEVEYRRVIGFTDLQYVSLSASGATARGIVADRVKLRNEQVSWILAGGYRVTDAERGIRLWSISNRLTLKGSPDLRRLCGKPRPGSTPSLA